MEKMRDGLCDLASLIQALFLICILIVTFPFYKKRLIAYLEKYLNVSEEEGK